MVKMQSNFLLHWLLGGDIVLLFNHICLAWFSDDNVPFKSRVSKFGFEFECTNINPDQGRRGGGGLLEPVQQSSDERQIPKRTKVGTQTRDDRGPLTKDSGSPPSLYLFSFWSFDQS